jgi:superfamily II DNA/RNA helicase
MARVVDEPSTDGFAALDLDPRLLSTVAALGYEEPTPIQREAIPPLLAGRDLLAEAPTGTGKTAAFALPTLQRIPIGQAGEGRTSALILVPTRELAMQVAEALHKYGREMGARVIPVYGGQPIGQQLRGLRRGVDIVVATPGRAVDHLKRGSLRFDQVMDFTMAMSSTTSARCGKTSEISAPHWPCRANLNSLAYNSASGLMNAYFWPITTSAGTGLPLNLASVGL